jgi:hypothetical protein
MSATDSKDELCVLVAEAVNRLSSDNHVLDAQQIQSSVLKAWATANSSFILSSGAVAAFEKVKRPEYVSKFKAFCRAYIMAKKLTEAPTQRAEDLFSEEYGADKKTADYLIPFMMTIIKRNDAAAAVVKAAAAAQAEKVALALEKARVEAQQQREAERAATKQFEAKIKADIEAARVARVAMEKRLSTPIKKHVEEESCSRPVEEEKIVMSTRQDYTWRISVCRHSGRCRNGDACRFIHDDFWIKKHPQSSVYWLVTPDTSGCGKVYIQSEVLTSTNSFRMKQLDDIIASATNQQRMQTYVKQIAHLI